MCIYMYSFINLLINFFLEILSAGPEGHVAGVKVYIKIFIDFLAGVRLISPSFRCLYLTNQILVIVTEEKISF